MKARGSKVSPSLRPLQVPPRQTQRLANGLAVHLVHRGSLPLVSLRLMLPHGSTADAPGKSGTAEFTARLMRRGAGGMTANELSEAIDFVGASMSGSADLEYLVVGVTTPTPHVETMVGLLGKVVREPSFLESEIELFRRRTIAQIQNDLDDPGELVDRALSRAVWGSHLYGRSSYGSIAELGGITADDVRQFHRARVVPANAHLFVVGTFDDAEMVKSLERHLGGWSGGAASDPAIPSWAGIAAPGQVIIVDKPEQTQVQVRIGARGVKRGHPQHFALTVMSGVLGGSFTSRLMREIRVKRGLSYGASCGFEKFAQAGSLAVSSFTKTETVGTLLDVALAEVEKMKRKGPTAAEVETSKRYIAGLYPGRLETNEALGASLAEVQHYGLPSDWVQHYRERIAAVTVKEAAAAASEHLFSDDQRVIVLVGNAEALRPTAEKYGAVSVVTPESLA